MIEYLFFFSVEEIIIILAKILHNKYLRLIPRNLQPFSLDLMFGRRPAETDGH